MPIFKMPSRNIQRILEIFGVIFGVIALFFYKDIKEIKEINNFYKNYLLIIGFGSIIVDGYLVLSNGL